MSYEQQTAPRPQELASADVLFDPNGRRYADLRRRNRGRDPEQRMAMPEARIFGPTITVAKVRYAPDGRAVIEHLSEAQVEG